MQAGSIEEAEETLRLICRKFSKNVENWEKLLLFYVKDCENEQKFQEVLRRGLQSLRDPIELKKRIGVIEYNNGSPEKGRTIFENLITEKPKRSDIWTVYIGLEAKFNSFEAVRDLYERVLSGKLSQKCCNAFAKAYYGYEVAQKHWNKAKEVAERFNLECKEIF